MKRIIIIMDLVQNFLDNLDKAFIEDIKLLFNDGSRVVGTIRD